MNASPACRSATWASSRDGDGVIPSRRFMKTYVITVMVRKRGAIGLFYTKEFTVNSNLASSLDEETGCESHTGNWWGAMFREWQETYGDTWEPSHIINARLDEESQLTVTRK